MVDFGGVGLTGEGGLEDFVSQAVGAFDGLEASEEGGLGEKFIEERAIGQEHCLLHGGGEVFGEEIGEDFCEVVAEGFVVWLFVAEGGAKRAGEGFGRERFVESAGEEGIEGWLAGRGGGSGVKLVRL